MDQELDVWKPSSDLSSKRTVPEFLGEETAGVPLRQALSVGSVLSNGWNLLLERPLLCVGTAVLLWAIGAFPGLVSSTLTALGVVDPSSMNPADVLANLGLTLGVALVSLVTLPLVLWLFAGTMRALAQAAEHDEDRWGVVVGSWGPALWLILFYLVLYILLTVVLVIVTFIALFVGVIAGAVFGISGVGVMSSEVVSMGIMGLVFLTLLPVLVWLGLTVLPMILAIVVDGRDPLSAIRLGWRSARGARWSMLLMLLPMVGVQILVVTPVVLLQSLVSPAAALVATLGMAPISIALDAVYRAGMATGWLMHVREPAKTRTWPFFQRHPSRWLEG